MKKIVALILTLVCLLTVTACSNASTKGSVLLKEGTVNTISVASRPAGYNYSFSGDAAQTVIHYISELNLLSDFSENPDEYDGMTWVIELKYDDGSNLTIYHFGNMFIRADNSSWYKMTYEEASRLDSLLNELSE